tara:strand:+ start:25476 stop:25724 length:249 start_codon:yes stop_codon:yes gene_type:complete
MQSVTQDLRVVDMIMEASHGNNVSIEVILPFIVVYPVAFVATWSVILGRYGRICNLAVQKCDPVKPETVFKQQGRFLGRKNN